MAYSNPLYDSALSATAQVRLNNVDMEKIESANGIATEGSYYGISFANLKTAGDETANTDGFGIVNDGSMANLYVNIGTIDAPIFVSISDRIAQLNLAQPSLGLDLDNITVRLGGIFADNTKLSNSDNRIYWMPAGSEGGDNVAAFNIFAIDQVNGIWGDAGDHRSATNIQVNIDVAAINDAPVVDVATDTVSVDEDGALSFSDVFNSVSDVDDDSLTVSLSVSNGELSLLTDAGLTYSDSDGSDGTIAFSGTKAAVNAALESLQYNPDANFNGTDQLQVVVTDGNSNGNGAGQLTDTALIDISVNSVNDAPVNNFSTDSIVIDTRDTDSYTFTDISVSDVDTGSGNITVSLSVNGGSLDLGATDNLSFDDADGSDGTLKFTGSLSDVNAALNGLTYSADTDVGDRTLTITTSDNGNSGAPGVLYDTDSIDITLQANQAPELGADDFNVSDNGITYVAGNSVSGNILSNDSDPESDAFSITQLSGFGGVDSDGSNDFYVNGAYGSLDLNSDGSFSYTVTDDSLAAGEVVTEVFTYTVLDSEGNESSTDISFTVSGANDAPQASDNYAFVSDDGETNADGNSVSGNVISGGVFGEDDTDPDDGDSLHVVGVYGNAGGEDDVQLEGIVTTTDGYGRVTVDLIQGYTSESFTDVDVVSFGNNTDSADAWTYVRDAWQGLGSTVNLDQFIFSSANDAFVSPDSATDFDSFYFDTTWHFGGDNVNAFTFAFAVSSELDYDGLSFYHSTDGINFDLVFDSVSLFRDNFWGYQSDAAFDGFYSVSDIDSLVSYDDDANFAGMGNLDLYYEEKGAGEDDDLLSGTYTGLYAAGTHYFRWVYEKDESVSNGYDAAYVGNIGSIEITSDVGLIAVDSDGTLINGDHGYLIMSSDGSYEYVVTDESLDDGDVVTETFTYVVADESGATDSANLNITVNGTNDAPEAFSDSNTVSDDGITGFDGNSVSGNVLTNDTDVDIESLSVAGVAFGFATDAGVPVDSDGTTVSGEYGYLTMYSDGDYTYVVTDDSLAQGEVVTEAFGYMITDGDATDGTALYITVTGANDGPVADSDNVSVSDDGITGTDGDTVTGNILSNDTDVDNGAVLSVVNVDGSAMDTDGITVSGDYGYLEINSDGSYSYTVTDESLDTNEVVTENFSYVMTDEFGATDASNLFITVNGSNDAPEAFSDSNTVSDDGITGSDGNAVSGDVLSNDTDVDVESFFVVGVDNLNDSDVGVAVDSDGTTVSGEYGYLTMYSDGHYTYVVTDDSLAQGEVVTENFSYMISDGNDTDTTTLSITVNGANDRPEAFSDTDAATDDGVAVSGNLLTNDTDVDNNDTLSVSSVGTDVDGSDGFTVYGSYGVLNVNTDGSYSYTVTDESLDTDDIPVNDYFYYVTSDEGGLTAPAALTINITGSNDAPEAFSDSNTVSDDGITGSDGNAVSGDVLSNDTDVDVESFFVVGVDNLNDSDVGVAVDSDGTTVSGEYGYLTMYSDGHYTYVVTDDSLAQGEVVTENFSYMISDGNDTDTTTLFITVTGANDGPDAVSDNISVSDDGITGTDGGKVLGSLMGAFTDVDNGAVLSVVNVGSTLMDSDGITVNGLYGYLEIDSNGGYSYTVTDDSLAKDAVVTENFSYVISDEFDATDASNLFITVNGTNDAPDASDTYASVYEDDLTVSGNVMLNATDVDDGATVSFYGGARDTDGDYGFVSFNSDGSYVYVVTDESLGVGDYATESFTYVVTDENGATDLGTLFITVNGDNDQPILDLDAEKVDAVFGSDLALSGLIAVSDTDVNDQMTVNLTVTNGTLGFADTDLNVTGDLDGSDGELEFTGSITDVNNALAKLKYTATEQADDTLVIIVNDDSGTDNDMAVGAIDITVDARDETFDYAFNTDGTIDQYVDMDPLSADYSNVVITGATAAELLVADTGTDVTLSDSMNTLTLGNVDFTILDGSKVSFADGSVLIANTSGAATTLLGSVHDDQLISGNQGDTLRGLDGNDLLIGGDGRDRLLGGNGTDIIIGGKGNDLLTGGSDNDFFVYKTSGFGTDLTVSSADNGYIDTIYDFNVLEGDRILLVDGGLSESFSYASIRDGFAETLSALDYADLVTEKNVQGGVQLTFDGGAKILLLGVSANDIDETNFFFASGQV